MTRRTNAHPINLNELLAYLQRNPHLVSSCDSPKVPCGRELYRGYAAGRLWFKSLESGEMHHVPVSCQRTPEAAASETGLQFEPEGFTVQKFGVTLYFAYQSERHR